MTTHPTLTHRLFQQILLVLLGLSSMLTINVCFAQSASSYGIRYTVDVWTGADGQPLGVLMPRSVRLSGKDKTAQLKNLFNQMKRNASSKYGTSSIAFKEGGKDAAPEVFIWLDESKTERHNEIIAEVVYTFSELGISQVNFPKFKMQPVTRKDINYAAFSLSLPTWQAIGLSSEYIWTQLSSGARISAKAYNLRLKSLDKEAVESTWKDLNISDDAALQVLRAATKHAFPNRKTKCVAATESADTRLRVLGAQCLSNLAAGALEGVPKILQEMLLEDPEDEVRTKTAEIIKASPHIRLKQIALLRDLVSTDLKTVLGTIPLVVPVQGDEITQSLQKLSTHKDETIRDAAQQALLTRKTPKTLLTTLQNQKTVLTYRQEIAVKLLSVNETKRIAMDFLASNGKPKHWKAVRDSLNSSAETVKIEVLSKAIANQSVEVSRDALSQFSNLGGLKALNALAAVKLASSTLNTTHLVTLNQLCAKLSDKLLFKLAKDQDIRLKKCAIKTLAGKVASGKSKLKKRLLPILKTQAKSKVTELRALAIEGLGDLNEKSTYALLLEATKDSDAAVIAAATMGLRYVPDSEARLLELASHPSPMVIAAALDAMGVQALPSAIPLILQSSEASDLQIRLASTRALGRLSAKITKPKAAFAFYSVRLTDGNAEVRKLALIGLSKSTDERSIQAMASLALDLDQSVQITAINLLGNSGSQQAIEGASAGLANTTPKVRRASIVALKKIGGAEAKAILKRHISKESNKELRSLIK